jgi:hypothetical protein
MTTATLTSLQTAVDELNALIIDRQILEAMDRFYGDDIVMIEGVLNMTTTGKAANEAREKDFVENLTSWDAKLISSVVDEKQELAFSEWVLTYNHKQWGDIVSKQVSVQRWRDGVIVHEAFYKL